MFKWLGGPRKTFPEGVHNTEYLFVYLKVRIFKVTVLIYYDHHLIIIWLGHFYQNTIDQKKPLISAVATQVLSPIAVVFGGRSLPPKFHTLTVNLAPRCASCPENPEFLLPCRQYHA